MSDLKDSMMESYLYETSIQLEALEKIIINESNTQFNSEEIDEIFRIMHTIKGASGMMSFNTVASLAHSAEDLFSSIRSMPEMKYDYTLVCDIMLEVIDCMNKQLENQFEEDEVSVAEIKNLIEKIHNYRDALSGASNKYSFIIKFDECNNMEDIRAFEIVHKLQSKVADLEYEPDVMGSDKNLGDVIRDNGLLVKFNYDKGLDEAADMIRTMLYVKEVISPNVANENLEKEALETSTILNEETQTLSDSKLSENCSESNISIKTSEQNLGKAEDKPEMKTEERIEAKVDDNSAQDTAIGEVKKEQRHSKQKISNFTSVSFDKIDKIMNLLGEMVIAEAMVVEASTTKQFDTESLNKAANQLDKITRTLQDEIISLRLVSVESVFQKMQRIVRDMSKKLDKNINFTIVGEDTEIDKKVIDYITDPIMHMVRNAIDHGIEDKAERLAKGKRAEGKLILEAKNDGGEVFIKIIDDGRGLDKDKLLEKARKSNLIHPDYVPLNDDEVYKMIFMPGFSTKDSASEFSGRGVGMDVVTKNIETIGGQISIDTQKDEGTTFTIRIPLTMAIIDGMITRVGKSNFTIPTRLIKESFRIFNDDIITKPNGSEWIILRNECIPIIRLSTRYDLDGGADNYEEGVLIRLEQNNKSVCLFVDEILSQQQVVIKNLPSYINNIRKIEGIAGCTLLGDGSISLLIDFDGLIS